MNQYNDTDKFVDLNCLDLADAKAITKQKIYDVALLARERRQAAASMKHVRPYDSSVPQNPEINLILTMQCGDDHLV